VAKITPNVSKSNTAKSAAPTAAPTAKKGGGSKRKQFDLVGSKDPNVYPFKGIAGDDGAIVAVPTGYDFATMKPLKKKDFAKPSLFKLYKAGEMDFKAAAFRKEAEQLAKSGDGKGAGKANRLVKMVQKAADLRKELESQGIDVEALLAATKAAPEAGGEATATK
jgi:hypothetical protein